MFYKELHLDLLKQSYEVAKRYNHQTLKLLLKNLKKKYNFSTLLAEWISTDFNYIWFSETHDIFDTMVNSPTPLLSFTNDHLNFMNRFPKISLYSDIYALSNIKDKCSIFLNNDIVMIQYSADKLSLFQVLIYFPKSTHIKHKILNDISFIYDITKFLMTLNQFNFWNNLIDIKESFVKTNLPIDFISDKDAIIKKLTPRKISISVLFFLFSYILNNL